MRKKKLGVIIIIAGLGAMLMTSFLSYTSPPSGADLIKELDDKREQKLVLIDRASVDWQRGLLGQEQFVAVIEESITDTEDLRKEYLSLNLPSSYDRYKDLSIASLDKQIEAFLKLRDFVMVEDASEGSLLRSEFDQLIITMFESHRDAQKELKRIEMEKIGSVNVPP